MKFSNIVAKFFLFIFSYSSNFKVGGWREIKNDTMVVSNRVLRDSVPYNLRQKVILILMFSISYLQLISQFLSLNRKTQQKKISGVYYPMN